MRTLTAMAIATMTAAPAGAQDARAAPGAFCAELKRVIAAAHPPRGQAPFAGLDARLGFTRPCMRSAGPPRPVWACRQIRAPERLSRAALGARTAACLPHALHAPSTITGDMRFILPGAEIRIAQRGGTRRQPDRIVTFLVEAMPLNRRGG